MKAIKIYTTILALLFFSRAYSDIIWEDHHIAPNCVMITNLDEYPDVSLLNYVYYVGSMHDRTSKIEQNECIDKEYKHNTIEIYAILNNRIEGVEDLAAIDLPNKPYALKSNIDITPDDLMVHDSVPINRFDCFYKILGFTDTTVVLFKWKDVYGFNNGKEDSVIVYECSVDVSKLQQAPAHLPPHKIDMNLKINLGDSVRVGDSYYTLPGKFSQMLTATDGNDSIINLEISFYELDKCYTKTFDTVPLSIIDTIFKYDTVKVVEYDTVRHELFDTQSVYITDIQTFFDTTTVVVNDTVLHEFFDTTEIPVQEQIYIALSDKSGSVVIKNDETVVITHSSLENKTLTVELEEKLFKSFALSDVEGDLLYEVTTAATSYSYPLDDLPPGDYNIELVTQDEAVIRKKLIIN